MQQQIHLSYADMCVCACPVLPQTALPFAVLTQFPSLSYPALRARLV